MPWRCKRTRSDPIQRWVILRRIVARGKIVARWRRCIAARQGGRTSPTAWSLGRRPISQMVGEYAHPARLPARGPAGWKPAPQKTMHDGQKLWHARLRHAGEVRRSWERRRPRRLGSLSSPPPMPVWKTADEDVGVPRNCAAARGSFEFIPCVVPRKFPRRERVSRTWRGFYRTRGSGRAWREDRSRSACSSQRDGRISF